MSEQNFRIVVSLTRVFLILSPTLPSPLRDPATPMSSLWTSTFGKWRGVFRNDIDFDSTTISESTLLRNPTLEPTSEHHSYTSQSLPRLLDSIGHSSVRQATLVHFESHVNYLCDSRFTVLGASDETYQHSRERVVKHAKRILSIASDPIMKSWASE